MDKIIEKRATFPEFNIKGNEVYTQIRNIGKDGKWYLSHYRKRFSTEVGLLELKRCFIEAQRYWMFQIPNENIVNSFGEKYFILDEDQNSEEERLNATILW